MIFKEKKILLTGGTGTFGKMFTKKILTHQAPKQLIIYSRDEMKQYMMAEEFENPPNLKFFIGDVRDKERLSRAMDGVDFVIHAAAMKIVMSAEENPTEAIRTNVLGGMNIIEAALAKKVKKVIALSTDKACNPVNLYGATKLCADKLFTSANSYTNKEGTRFAVVRYGNVVGSRGSVIPFFKKKRNEGVLTVTDERMTRFWITIDDGVDFVMRNFERMQGGEIFVPKISSMKIMDLAKAIGPDCDIKIIGIRPGEKIHEIMISADDARHTMELDDCYIIEPDFVWYDKKHHFKGKPVPSDFEYSSDKNDRWVTDKELQRMIGE